MAIILSPRYRSILASAITIPVVLPYCSYHRCGITAQFASFPDVFRL